MVGFKISFGNILVAILLVIIAVQYFWPKPTVEPIDESQYIKIGSKRHKILMEQVEVRYIPVTTKTIAYKPAIVKFKEPVVIYPKNVIDTAAVVKAFYTQSYYEDIQPIDSIGTVMIMDTIHGNSIVSRRLQFDYDLPIETISIITETPPVNKVFLGGGININSVDFVSAGYAGLMFKTKKDKLFGVQIGAVNKENALSPYVGASLYWKIKLRRN